MQEEKIKELIRRKVIRNRQADLSKIKSMVESAKINAEVAKEMKTDEKHATTIFREIYESIRQLGDTLWWINGFEPLNHEVSLEILKEADIKDKIKLNSLDRFKAIRNDANYRGYRVSINQAQEILDFWKNQGKEIMGLIESKLKSY